MKEKFKNSPLEEDESMCRVCKEEPVFMNGLCVYCYEDEFYNNEEFSEKQKDSKMVIHGQAMKDPHQQKISRERTISKINKRRK